MKYIKTYENLNSNISEFHEKISEILKNECKPFIQLSKSCEYPLGLWRGVTQKFLKEKAIEVCKLSYRVEHGERIPVDTPLNLHNRLNVEFIKKFGWPVRNGVFCLPDKGTADNYASIAASKLNNYDFPCAYFFVPVGDFKYCWSPKYKDLTSDIKVKSLNSWQKELSNLSDTKVRNIVNTYKDDDIEDANYTRLKDASEISFNCSEYFLISERYFIGVGYDFWNW